VEEILKALLDISRLDTGAMKPEISVFPVGELLQQLKIEFGPQAAEKGLTLTVMPCSLDVRSDRRLLRRVLQNFVSNAIKYTTGRRVLLGCRRRKGVILVEVHDTGPGIPKSKHALIFKEFQRLHGGSSTVQGIGLGLSIVERIARMLGHKLLLSSRVGYGSVFGIELPVSLEPAPQKLPPYPRALSYGRFDGCVVLCVDNEPAILDGMRALLENWRCTVLQAVSTAEAIEVLDKTGLLPDLILADYHLESGTGIGCIDAVRAKIGHDMPGVLITANHSPDLEEEARNRELHLLRKPIKPAALRALMMRLTPRRTAAE
jgi:CheY-like chemotaxis protein